MAAPKGTRSRKMSDALGAAMEEAATKAAPPLIADLPPWESPVIGTCACGREGVQRTWLGPEGTFERPYVSPRAGIYCARCEATLSRARRYLAEPTLGAVSRAVHEVFRVAA